MQTHLISQVNEYMFNKKESIVIPQYNEREYTRPDGFATQYAQVRMISGMLCNLHDLGYTIPKEELPKLYDMTEQELNEIVYQPLLKAAKEAKGANVEHRILFPGFPDSVKNVDIQTLSDIRFMSYFTTFMDVISDRDPLGDGSITTEFVKDAVQSAVDAATSDSDARSLGWAVGLMSNDKEFYSLSTSMMETIMEKSKKQDKERLPRIIHLVDDKAYFDMVKNMLSARTSLSTYDQQMVMFTVDNFHASLYMPEKVQFKETQAMLDKYNFEKGYIHNIDIKTIKDYERLLVSLSNGDISLSKKSMIRNFSNSERKKLAEIFKTAVRSNRPLMIESMANKQALRFCDNVLKNRLHLNTMINNTEYNQIIKSATIHQTAMSKYEENLARNYFSAAATHLSKYSPTLFIQHLREIVGKLENSNYEKAIKEDQIGRIQKMVSDSARKVDLKTLLSAEKELVTQCTKETLPYKIMIPKSPTAKIVVKENKSQQISSTNAFRMQSAIRDGIKWQIENHMMGGSIKIEKGTKIYIDPALKDCPIPTIGRNDMGKNRTVAPGTKLPTEKCDVLRAMLYKQNDQDQFIDFSAAFFDKNFKMVGQVSWNNLKTRVGNKTISYHSGDTAACSGKGCTEIIDIDLKATKEEFPQAQYVAYMAVMWNGTPLSSCNQLFMTLAPTQEVGKQNGEMIKGKTFVDGSSSYSYNPHSGQNFPFNPADVQFKVDITGDATASIPMFYNIDTGKVMIANIETRYKSFDAAINGSERHFDLPKSCEAIENYANDIALKCFAYENMQVPTIRDLAECYLNYTGAMQVSMPGMADVVFATDRAPIDDLRYHENEDDVVPQIVITPFDKDVITSELIFDPKTIVCEANVIQHDEKAIGFSQDDIGFEIK